jgi:hypothetical protein
MTLHFFEFTDEQQEFLKLNTDRLLDWFFDDKVKLEYRVMSLTNINLERDFADRLIKVRAF